MINKFFKKDKRTNLEKEIDSVLKYMATYPPNSDEYSKMADNLEKLYKAKSLADGKQDRYITPDNAALIFGNLLGIALILGHEKANVITSKALGFVIKGRV